jgi:uncharacterized membrane protein
MRRWTSYLPILVVLAGVTLLIDATLRGTAHASIVLIVPVLSGSSPEFVIGTLLTFLGILGILLLAAGVEVERGGGDAAPPGGRGGGVVLIGPVPIFFGEWKAIGRRGYWGWVTVGAIVSALIILLAVWLWFGA